jgi:hypothetical protein
MDLHWSFSKVFSTFVIGVCLAAAFVPTLAGPAAGPWSVTKFDAAQDWPSGSRWTLIPLDPGTSGLVHWGRSIRRQRRAMRGYSLQLSAAIASTQDGLRVSRTQHLRKLQVTCIAEPVIGRTFARPLALPSGELRRPNRTLRPFGFLCARQCGRVSVAGRRGAPM